MILPLLNKTKELVSSCSCSEGCPACIHSPKCGSGNKPLDKMAAITILKYLTGDLNMNETVAPSQIDEKQPEPVFVPSHIGTMRQIFRIGFFDLETQRLSDEVGGWQNKHLMRMSVGILYETLTDDFHIYKEEDIPALIHRLKELDLVVGFNIVSFDYEVLKPYTPFNFDELPTFDLLQEIHKRLGFRLSLDHLGERTLGRGKAADGTQAVKWFREGSWEALINYCKEDVALTRDLFTHAVDQGHLLYADRRNRILRLPTDWNLAEIMRERARSSVQAS